MSHAPLPTPPPQPRPRTGPGLRLRLWLACLSGGLVAAIGTLWLLATPSLSPSDPAVYGWLAGVACASLVFGLLLGLWVDHHVVSHLNGLLLGLRSGRVSELRGLPAGTGWGELSELGDAVQETLERRRHEARALMQLERTREQLASLQSSIDRWQLTERWERPAMPEGDVGDVVDVLSHAIQRRAAVDEQNRDAARQVASDLSAVITEAQEAASLAERGFVEATSLQTSVRELQRLSGELSTGLVRGIVAAQASPDPTAERARQTLEELVVASSESVASLGLGLRRVQDISDQVQRIANRATLIGIQALSGTGEPTSFADELKQLAHDVRQATDRTAGFAQEIERAVADADATMRAARERAIARFEAPAPAPAVPTPAPDVRRLVERVLEMVQDATRKSERVSNASERASSTAERLARRLEAQSSDADALVVRLAPVGESPALPAAPPPGLRLVDDDTEDENPESGGAEPRGEEHP
jgi:methyl-accepting chemotaxis protein